MFNIAHLGLVVKDIAKSKNFYCKVLDCTLKGEWQTQDLKAIELLSGSLIIELLEYQSPGKEVRTQGIYDHLAFNTDNIADSISYLKELEIEFETAAPRQLMNGKKIIFFHGPDGERIELVEEP